MKGVNGDFIVVDESAYEALKGSELHHQREALARQQAKQEAHDALQAAKGKAFAPPMKRGNRAARRAAAARTRPKAPRW